MIWVRTAIFLAFIYGPLTHACPFHGMGGDEGGFSFLPMNERYRDFAREKMGEPMRYKAKVSPKSEKEKKGNKKQKEEKPKS